MGQYGWNVVHGLARTGALSAITVLAQQAPDAKAAPLADDLPPGLVRTRRTWFGSTWGIPSLARRDR